MATKVKKQISASKEIVYLQSTKNEASSSSATQKAGAKLQSESGDIKKKGRGPMKNSVKSITAVKKTVQMKAKNVRKDLKINPKTIERVLMENGKDLEGKKILLKNGVKGVKRGRKPRVPKIKVEPGEDPPPVLEPIFPQDINMEVKKTPKKRGRKPYKLPTLINVMAIKSEPLDDTVGTSEFTGDSALLEVINAKVKKPRQRKPKVEPGSIDEVMNDLTFLIDTTQIKTDPNQSALELSKIDNPKVKRMTKKQRLEGMKEDLTKKENIENSVRKLNPAEVKLIERLDLNVAKYKTDCPKEKRRHSVEKFPISSVDSGADGLTIPQLSIFSQMPSLSPRTSRRVLKMGLRKSSPYSTRSDSSTRLLRNGKHRQLKNFTLLEGLENPTRRRRLQSDFSVCEVPSKMSGYESDSSYSDLASLHGSEKDGDVLKLANKDVDGILMDESSSFDVKTSVASDAIKSTVGSEVERPLFDTNSNVCDNVNDSVEIGEHTKLEYMDSNAPLEETSSTKVPNKGILLNIMKHAFNDMALEAGLAKNEQSKLHIGASSSVPDVEMKLCPISLSDLSVTPTTTNLPQSALSEGISEEEELIKLLNETAPELSNTGVKHKTTGNKAAKHETIEDVFSANIGNDSTGLINFPKHSTPKIVLPEQAPILTKEITLQNVDKEDVIPVIDNMAVAVLEPQQNPEHLEPPLLESSVPLPEPPVVKSASKIDTKTNLIDDKKIGIAVTEKDNVVLFSIEHLADDSGDLDVSNEDISENIEDGHSPIPQNTSGTEAAIKEAEYLEDAESIEVDQSGAKCEESQVDRNKTIENAVEIENTSMSNESKDIEVSETSQVAEQASAVEASEVAENEGDQLGVKQSEKSLETDVHMTEKECDKPSETFEKSDETVDNSKVEENVVQESPEELAQKTSILNALGLQSSHTVVKEEGPASGRKKGKSSTSKGDGYTGTLKTVIKINKKKGKNSFKMTLQKNKNKSDAAPVDGDDAYKIMKEAGPSCSKYNKDSSDTTGAHRKSHYPNRSNMDGSSEHTSDSEQANSDKNQPEKSLIVPEKSSSYSIHPERECKDECSYCFGKFGLFDTPSHIKQVKSVERQNKILATETHLTSDSCLCDACYRHVDRKSNSPSYMNKSQKRNALVAPGPRQNHCYVMSCNNVSTNILRRKWIIKMRSSICDVINVDLDNPGLHSIPICDEHFTLLEHLMICAMCKRRLARNHIHYLGPEVRELNQALKDEAIPVVLPDKPVVCKMCKCFASIMLKDPEERMENSISFFKDYKRRLVNFNSKEPLDANVPLEPIAIPGKIEKSIDKKKPDSRKRKRVRNSSNETNSQKDSPDEIDDEINLRTKKRVPSSDTNNSQSANQSRAQSPDYGDDYGGVDYNTLIPAIAMDCPSDSESKKDGFSNKSDGLEPTLSNFESMGRSVNISAYQGSEDTSRCNDLAAQKLVQNPSISLKPNYTAINNELWRTGPTRKRISNPALSIRQLFPGEEELGLVSDIDFQNVSTRTPEGWEKSVATIQYDEDTKVLWQELQKPYGSMSSFLRHLVLLEKYFRNGDLVLSPSASHHAVNYRESVHNRLRAYDNIPSNSLQGPPSSMLQGNKMSMKTSGGGITNQSLINGLPPVTISQIGRFSENFNSKTPITLQQLNQPPLYPTNVVLQNIAASRSRPPGLISINQRAPAPAAMKTPIPSQKIKFPITKNWRPNLIPISPSKKGEKKPGLIQVVSGGKPYHITIEDYKKMCAIKRSFEAKQKRLLQEQQFTKQMPQKQQSMLVNPHSVLKTFTPKKELAIGKSSAGTVSESKPISLIPIPSTVTSGNGSETILEKLDKQVERLSKEFAPAKISGIIFEKNPAIQIIPKIPKSLTVIPQTVSKASSSRAVLHVIKSNSNGSSNEEDSNSQP